MKIVVLKFGGTSVGSISRIKKVAKIIEKYSKKFKVNLENNYLIKLSLYWLDTLTNVVHLLNCLSDGAPT